MTPVDLFFHDAQELLSMQQLYTTQANQLVHNTCKPYLTMRFVLLKGETRSMVCQVEYADQTPPPRLCTAPNTQIPTYTARSSTHTWSTLLQKWQLGNSAMTRRVPLKNANETLRLCSCGCTVVFIKRHCQSKNSLMCCAGVDCLQSIHGVHSPAHVLQLMNVCFAQCSRNTVCSGPQQWRTWQRPLCWHRKKTG